jgi:tRNA G10  N-methylase Trm11
MANLICILGRQPGLGLAELDSLLAGQVEPFGSKAAIFDDAAQTIDLNQLGGSQKVGLVLAREQIKTWVQIKQFIKNQLLNNLVELPSGKIKLGISLYNLDIPVKQITELGLEIKKELKARGRSARLVPNQQADLSSAQVIHNQLTGITGFEIICVVSGNATVIGKTLQVQDIEGYSARDFGRPKRDAKIGMMPPKLAQIMINLAKPSPGTRLLDPFCGTGVVLQEALLMGLSAYGSDINPKMVDYTLENLAWLKSVSGSLPSYQVELADATSYRWRQPIDVVVSETYLGKPLLNELSDQDLDSEMHQVDKLVRASLTNLTGQIKPGSAVCLAVPAWLHNQTFVGLPLLDHLSEIGYNHLSFKTVSSDQLLYYRPNQLVARRLLVLSRK